MSNPPANKSENQDLDLIISLSKLQAMNINESDLIKVQQQFKLISSHAQRIMQFDLHEEIEPAGEFRP